MALTVTDVPSVYSPLPLVVAASAGCAFTVRRDLAAGSGGFVGSSVPFCALANSVAISTAVIIENSLFIMFFFNS